MAGIIGVSALELGRFSRFTSCLANLVMPQNTTVQFETGIDIAINRRNIVRLALEKNADWVWFVDDDMMFPINHLERLLIHDVPLVASLYLNRKPPFGPMAYNSTKVIDNKQVWATVSLNGAPETGLVEIIAAGTGGMLIKTDVFRAIPYDTWFLHDEGTEDLPFCARVVAAGFSLYLDLEARMGHISTYTIWPTFKNDIWQAGISLTDKDVIIAELAP